MSGPRVFVANRGEIALRVIGACQSLGMEAVLGCSSADRDSLPARRADRAVTIGGPRSSDSYLAREPIVHAALATGCAAVHPGYGFLSEDAQFARLCLDNGLVFVGPRPEQLEAVGDKLQARKRATSLGVPVSPGGPTTTVEAASDLAASIGYPVMVKAAHGGGGRGMKVAADAAELRKVWPLAAAEAQSAFGNDTVFLERYVRHAKHVEVQVLGDGRGNAIHLGERECSVQFRHQKVMEEAPCAALDDSTRDELHRSALDFVRDLEYLGLGTVEFLLDVDRRELHFLEVNPRVQVEHPVTEAVTGIDLIREQLLVALGHELGLAQQDINTVGHAVEVRLTAQDPEADLAPSPGPVERWRPAPWGGVRWDTHMYEGYVFPPYYDALMAKVIAHGPDRTTALDTLARALDDLEVEGLTTSLPLLRQLVRNSEVRAGTVTTSWLQDHLQEVAR